MSESIVQYCQQCGKPLNAQARFCGHCGQPVPPLPAQNLAPPRVMRPPVPAQPSAPAQPAEIIVAALPVGAQRSGFLGMKAEGFILVLTNARILFAKQTAEIMKESARQAKEAAKQGGKGFFGQWGAVMGSNSGQRYLQLPPQTILAEAPGNYYILNEQIRSARVKDNYDQETGRSEVKLILESASGKIELIYTQAGKKEIKQALQQTLGNRVR